jgi:hypothetical protein
MLTGMRTIGITVSTGAEGIATGTVDMDFPATFALVTVSISRFLDITDDDNLVIMRAGILNFRFRNPDNSETQVDFPAGPNDPINALPAAFSHDQVTHVTMQVFAAGGFTRGLMTAFFWG